MAGMGNLSGLMQQAQRMQRDLAKLQEDLKERMVEGSSGDGAVTVIASGAQEIMSIKVSPEAVDPDDVETLEDLLIVAVNNALEKSRDMQRAETEKITGGMNFPGMM